MPLRLRHIHLPSTPALGVFPSYETASAVQEVLRRRLLAYKDSTAESPSPPPPPTLLTFTPQPIYTLGRRLSLSSLSPTQLARLRAPLSVSLPSASSSSSSSSSSTFTFRPSVAASPRGGLTTYHGPGQAVLWPVLDLRGLGGRHASFTVRSYARLLEDTTAALLRRLWGLEGFTTEDPGVWVQSRPGGAAASSPAAAVGAAAAGGGRAEEGGEVRKIAAMGVYLRRHVSSLGTAINLDMPTTTATAPAEQQQQKQEEEEEEEEARNPWARFVACGLEGKGVTCVAAETAEGAGRVLDAEAVAVAWAEELATRLGVDGVERAAGVDVEGLLEEARSSPTEEE
ncbi:Lipoyltransferase [Pleurostoma richardsiae]|uniref:Octanoyltransferase n=1 Tax=Pleurostoma richardsiae TaxID=41990 RepID=A0AA38RZ39_9PEZI|nr:Lipoyltransferase [Pleurostoma richardsiae]